MTSTLDTLMEELRDLINARTDDLDDQEWLRISRQITAKTRRINNLISIPEENH